ncbi:MAG TPA: glycosyltransferase [Verrucomicrobiae bacterium]|jgi:glycosyltransferase involved in cell wall biosynthesis|nr:glycosyltransferase [Verrucomicrobiae bacterium]
MEAVQPAPDVQIIVPARNEQACVGRCLESLAGQQGIRFAITLVDDASTDRTRAIAEAVSGVRVIAAGEPPQGTMGKCNALIVGARGATAKWLLFTDADTFHCPGSLAAAIQEAEDRGVDLLSYSPAQETGSFAEMALMPVVFGDLAQTYPPDRVNDPADPVVAANGQYLLVRRGVYERLGGHAAVAGKILEDVELARLFKGAGRKIWFRHGAGAVQTRMYRDFVSLRDGWTKNLALLFHHPLRLALVRGLEFIALLGSLVAAVVLLADHRYAMAVVFMGFWTLRYWLFLARIAKAHFPVKANAVAFFGLPLFSWLLCRSWVHAHVRQAVTWKGRTYSQSEPSAPLESSIRKESLT